MLSGHALPGKQRELLEHDRAVRPGAVHRHAAHQHAAAGRHLEAGGHAQAGGLAAARRPDQRHELLVGDREIDVLERREGLAVPLEAPAHVVELDGAHASPLLRRTSASSWRSATSISSPTTPMAIIPAITVGVEMLLWPCTIM